MSDLCCVVYMSRSAKQMNNLLLQRLLMDARAFNQEANVTGVLLHHQDVFFQYFEGECGTGKGVEQVYQRIKGSSQHTNIDELLTTQIDQRVFPNWVMGSTYVSETHLLSLQNADWKTSFLDVISQRTDVHNQGLEVLLSVVSSITDVDTGDQN